VSTVAKPTGTLPSPSAPLTAARPGTAEGGKLGVGLLVALVVGSILGSGIFGLPQNMAAAQVPAPSSSAGPSPAWAC
jgi:amino acid transporter